MRTYRQLTAVLGLALATACANAQQNYPTKSVRLIVAYPPGGAVDIVARLVANKLTESFGTTVLVDNRPGAAGMIGTEAAVRATPDGYTMIAVEGAYAANAALHKLPYDPVDDVSAIALIGVTGFVVTLHPSVPIMSVRELIAFDKKSPGKLNYGSGGAGSVTHLAGELFNHVAGTRLVHVPFKGMGLALNDLLGGQIDLVFGGMPPMMPHVKSKRLRGIAVTTAKRSNALPEIASVAEAAPGYEAVQWFAVLGPKALPKDIAARWNRAIDRIVQLPDVKERMASDGVEPIGGPPERVVEVLKRDLGKWQNVVRVAGIKPGS
jgi:tripartite-type tricarboxylate transporter receptor subunit TctC